MADWRPVVTRALLGQSGQPPATATVRTGVLGSGNPLATLNWDALNAIVRDQVVRLPACRMIRLGQLIDPSHFTEGASTSPAAREIVVPSKVARLLDQGVSLVLHDLQRYHEPARVLTRWLSWTLGVPLFVNAFATPARGEALAVHSDPYAAWLVQTHGSKDWRVWSPGQDPGTDRPAVEVRLRIGDALWIPRRWVHHGVSTELSSIHLTLALRPIDQTTHPGTVAEPGPPAGNLPVTGCRERFLALPIRWPAGYQAKPEDAVHPHPDGILARCEQADGSLRIFTADDEFELNVDADVAFSQICSARRPLPYRTVEDAFHGCPASLAVLLRSRLLCTMTAPLECRLAADDC